MAVLGKNIRLIGAVGGGAGWFISPHGYNLYRIQAGDSFASLAATYLGDASRSNEIYSIQSPEWRAQRKNDPSVLFQKDEIYMPQEAIDTATDLGFVDGGAGEAPSKVADGKTLDNGTDVLTPRSLPTAPSAPRVTPIPTPAGPSGPPAPPPAAASGGFGSFLILGGGIAAAAIVGAVGYHFVAKPAKRSNPKRRRSRGHGARFLAAAAHNG